MLFVSREASVAASKFKSEVGLSAKRERCYYVVFMQLISHLVFVINQLNSVTTIGPAAASTNSMEMDLEIKLGPLAPWV